MKRGAAFLLVSALTAAACASFGEGPSAASPDAGEMLAPDASTTMASDDGGTPAPTDCDGAIFCETFASALDASTWTTPTGDSPPTSGNGELEAQLPGDQDTGGERIQTTLATSPHPIRVSFDVEVANANFEGTAVLLASVGIADEFIGLYADSNAKSPSLFVTLSTNHDQMVGAADFAFGRGTHVELQIHPGSPGDVTFFASPPDGGPEQMAGAKTSFAASGDPILTIGPTRPQGKTGALNIRYFNVLVRPLQN